MAQKKSTKNVPVQNNKAGSGKNNNMMIVIGVIVVAVIGAGVWFASGSGKSAGTSAAAAPADEAKYIGRLLPAGYKEPSVAGPQSYTSTIKMASVTAAMDKTVMSVPVDQVVSGKIVYFEHQRTDGQTLPMIAYVKPSGKLFVGVSFCLPCKGTKQRIDNGQLTCESCGTTRDLETGVGTGGACKLYPLDEVPATVSGGKITIQNSVLDNWQPQPQDRPVGA